MTRRSKLSLLAFALAVAIAVLMFTLRSERTPAAAPTQASSEPSAVSTELAPPSAERIETAIETPQAVAVVGTKLDRRALIRGRFVDSNAAPLANVAVKLSGRVPNDDRRRAWRHAIDWKDVEGTSDGDGRFELRFDPPPPYMFDLDASLSGLVAVHWDWYAIEPGDELDVGEVTLERGGTLHGVVLTRDGLPLTSGWSVIVRGAREQGAPQDKPYTLLRPTDEEPGGFTVEDLAPGKHAVELSLSGDRGAGSKQSAQIRAGEVTEIELATEERDRSRTIEVQALLGRTPWIPFDATHAITLRTGDGRRITGRATTPRSTLCTFDELEVATYEVVVEHPAFETWRTPNVEPGAPRVVARLIGAASLDVHAFDAATNAVVVDFELTARYIAPGMRTSPSELRAAHAAAPEDGLYHLPAGDWELTLRASGFAAQTIDASALGAGEVRRLDFALLPGTRIAGRLLDAAGQPLAKRYEVALHVPAQVDDGPNSVYVPRGTTSSGMDRMRTQVDACKCDDEGAFSFDGIEPGRYVLRAFVAPGLAATLELDIAAGERRDDIELLLPPSAFLSGHLLARDLESFSGLQLRFGPARGDVRDLEAHHWSLVWTGRQLPVIERDGSYRAGPLPIGEARAWLVFPVERVHSGWSAMAPERDLGTIELAAGENTHDFDLAELQLGAVEVRVAIDGASAAGAVVELLAPLGAPDGEPYRIHAICDSRGVARLRWVPTGTWRVHVQPSEPLWRAELPQLATARAGQRAELDVAIPLYDGTITIDDPSAAGAALYLRSIVAMRERESRVSFNVRVDDDGRLRLRLPVGRYEVSGASLQGGFEVDWTATGAVPSTAKLPR